MLDHIPGCVPPIVEYLRSENMPTDTPDRLVVLLAQPLVSEHLRIIIMHLERAMVHVAGLVRAHEKRVVVDVVITAVDVREDGDVFLRAVGLVDVEEVRGY